MRHGGAGMRRAAGMRFLVQRILGLTGCLFDGDEHFFGDFACGGLILARNEIAVGDGMGCIERSFCIDGAELGQAGLQ